MEEKINYNLKAGVPAQVQYNQNQLMNVREAGKILDLSKSALYNAIATGYVGPKHHGTKAPPYVKVGGSIRYRYGDLVDWIQQLGAKPNRVKVAQN